MNSKGKIIMASTTDLSSLAYDPRKLKITVNGVTVHGLSAFERLDIHETREGKEYVIHFQGGSASLPKLTPLINSGLVEITVEYPEILRDAPALNHHDKVYLDSILTKVPSEFPIVDLVFKTKKKGE